MPRSLPRLAIAALLLAGMAGLAGASPLGEEVPPNEAASIAAIRAAIVDTYQQRLGTPGSLARRDAHAKAHGCVRATFTVLPRLAPELRAGVFALPRSYPALIRFSNGFRAERDDHVGDGRGMAIKLIGVAGRKLLPREAWEPTQDFLLINFPVFFVRNAADYVSFVAAEARDRLDLFFVSRPQEAGIAAATGAQVIGDVLDQSYFSMTAYRLGQQAVKYRARPVACGTRAAIVDDGRGATSQDPDYLRARLAARLETAPACFDFMVQPRTVADRMPVEDPTVTWSEAEAPFVTVASITIPPLPDSAVERSFCENLSFTPWHSLPEHRPLGGINRVRRAVYETISTLRHQLNHALRVEPTALPASDSRGARSSPIRGE